jgi:hypothetical protein
MNENGRIMTSIKMCEKNAKYKIKMNENGWIMKKM